MVTKIVGFDLGNRDLEKKMVLDMDQTGMTTIHYLFWLIEDDAGFGLIDTGFDPEVARQRGVRDILSPAEALNNIGVRPEQIRFVLVSHLHWDHFGAAAFFPNAIFYIQKKDIHFFTGPYGQHPRVGRFCTNLPDLQRLSKDGRLRMIDGTMEITPEIGVFWLGGHTPGLQGVKVKTGKGTFVFAVDDSFFFENYEEKIPSLLNFDLPESLGAFQTIGEIQYSSDRFFVIPGHDPALLRVYPGLNLL